MTKEGEVKTWQKAQEQRIPRFFLVFSMKSAEPIDASRLTDTQTDKQIRLKVFQDWLDLLTDGCVFRGWTEGEGKEGLFERATEGGSWK